MAKAPDPFEAVIIHKHEGEGTPWLRWLVAAVLVWAWAVGVTWDGVHYHVGCDYPEGVTVEVKPLPHGHDADD